MRLSFLILIIFFVCFIFIYSFFIKSLKDSNEHINHNNIWYEILLNKNNDLESVVINDYKGRSIFVCFSELGICSFSIIDNKSNYKIENIFYPNFTNDMYINKHGFDTKSSEEQKIFYRRERFNNIEKEYNINYDLFPYFFNID